MNRSINLYIKSSLKRKMPHTSISPFRQYFGYGLLLGTMIFGISCDKVLDQTPVVDVDESLAITDSRSAAVAVNGLYNELQNGSYYGRNFQICSDVSSDIAQSVGTWDFYREMDTYQVTSGNTEVGNMYYRGYRAINQANNVIAKVPELADVSAANKNLYIGQAYFIRGLAFFDLNRLFGGVPGVVGTLGLPIVLTPSVKIDESAFPTRPSLQDAYNQVEQDLLKALELLPETNGDNRSQAVKGTARALLSRYYMYVKKFDQTLSYSSLVIADSKYILNPSFSAIFENKLTTESIFELNFNASDLSNIRNWYFPSANGGRGDLAVHLNYYNDAIADPKDSRGKLFGFDNTSKIYYPTKYKLAGNLDNIHVIRISEMYLNRAEAKAQLNDLPGALTDLNRVHTRAGCDPLVVAGQPALLAAILQERKLEFAEEGHRFFDLVRTGNALAKLTAIDRKNGPNVALTAAGRQVFPIPSFEINSNKNTVQNDAYK
ncbi:MAG TPA: RagB/SusD family nutrient uptake outer membrane protein [Flavitalea sp.]|nr:RagB/SusD family nutrient uptake outer membrane protein [Flavitalea sp.]